MIVRSKRIGTVGLGLFDILVGHWFGSTSKATGELRTRIAFRRLTMEMSIASAKLLSFVIRAIRLEEGLASTREFRRQTRSLREACGLERMTRRMKTFAGALQELSLAEQ